MMLFTIFAPGHEPATVRAPGLVQALESREARERAVAGATVVDEDMVPKTRWCTLWGGFWLSADWLVPDADGITRSA